MRIVKTFKLGDDKAINAYLHENWKLIRNAVITYNQGVSGLWAALMGKADSTLTVILETEQDKFDELAMVKTMRINVLGQLHQAKIDKRYFTMQSMHPNADGKARTEIMQQLHSAESRERIYTFQIRCINEMIKEIEEGEEIFVEEKQPEDSPVIPADSEK